jgi:hypothetical protein
VYFGWLAIRIFRVINHEISGEYKKVKKQKYFISYTTHSPSDIAWATWVSWVLENKLGAETIIQEYDFHVGDNFKERMDNALRCADAVVCVLTRTYSESANCTEEWTNADKIIPVRFDDCTPPGLLKSRIYIDLYGLDKDSARDRLIAKLQVNTRPIEEPDAPFTNTVVDEAKSEPEFPVSSAIAVGVIKHNLPNRNKYFTGRDDILSKIYAAFQSSRVVSLIGAGGFGKTQIAIEYAYIHAAEYKLMWYFNAESETQLQDDYREFVICNLNVKNAAELDFLDKENV